MIINLLYSGLGFNILTILMGVLNLRRSCIVAFNHDYEPPSLQDLDLTRIIANLLLIMVGCILQ